MDQTPKKAFRDVYTLRVWSIKKQCRPHDTASLSHFTFGPGSFSACSSSPSQDSNRWEGQYEGEDDQTPLGQRGNGGR